jgi:sulfite oxidase
MDALFFDSTALTRAVSRRAFLTTSGRVVLGMSILKAFPVASFVFADDTVPEIDKSKLIVRESEPQNLETSVDQFTTWITPNELFYVRTHNDTPKVNLSQWRLQVEGEVGHPLTLTLEDLQRWSRVSETVTLECSGNGRAFHHPGAEGVQWEKGAVGNARWTGIRLADVLKKAGIKERGKHVMFNGADQAGKKPEYIRSIPLQKALHPSTILAYEMNGQTLPVPHGYPLRLIVPGWTGNHSVKWLTHIALIPEEHDGHFMKEDYRVPTTYVEPGTTVEPSEMAVITSLPVKSMITAPRDQAQLQTGRIQVSGIAYGGEGEIVNVEVSTDLGSTWKRATLGEQKARYAWRLWRYAWDVKKPGSYLIMSRARDHLKRVQPIEPFWNPKGLLWNVIDHIRVNIH